MEVLSDYHLFFMAMAFGIFFISMILLFIDNTKDKTIAALILCAFNYLLCMINSLAFFAIGIIGVDGGGTAHVNAYYDMQIFYAIFFLLHWLNIILIYYCWWLWVRDPWNVGQPGSSEIIV